MDRGRRRRGSGPAATAVGLGARVRGHCCGATGAVMLNLDRAAGRCADAPTCPRRHREHERSNLAIQQPPTAPLKLTPATRRPRDWACRNQGAAGGGASVHSSSAEARPAALDAAGRVTREGLVAFGWFMSPRGVKRAPRGVSDMFCTLLYSTLLYFK